MSVLGLNFGYTVKYKSLPSGVPSDFALGTLLGKGLYLTVIPLSCPNTDTIQFILKSFRGTFKLKLNIKIQDFTAFLRQELSKACSKKTD